MLSAGAITGAEPNGKNQTDWLKSNFGLAGLVGQPPANSSNAGPLFNRPDDRLKVTNALGLYLPGKKLGLSQLDQPLSGEALGKALGDYEKANQLPVSGQAAPGGKTWTHLLGKIGTWVKDLPFGDAKTYAELTTPDPDKLHRILAGVKAEREERKPQVQVLKFADGVAEEKEFQNLRRALAEGKLDPHKGSYSREEIAAASGMAHGGAKLSGQLRTTQRQPPDEDREAQASTPAGPQVAQAEEEVRPSNAEMRAKDFPQNILDLFDPIEDQAKWDAQTKGFYHSLARSLIHEQGWNPRDGGTWRGVTQNFYDDFREREADNPQYAAWPQYVGNLTEAQAANLYLTEFYQRPQYDRLTEVPGLRGDHSYLVEQVFDMGINSSPRHSSNLFKEAINAVLSENEAEFNPIESGSTRIDDATIAALQLADTLGLLDDINNEMVDRRLAFINDSGKTRADEKAGLRIRAESYRVLQ